MKFKTFYQSKEIDFEKINKSLWESLRDEAFSKVNKKGINKFVLMTDEQLQSCHFFEKYPHLI